MSRDATSGLAALLHKNQWLLLLLLAGIVLLLLPTRTSRDSEPAESAATAEEQRLAGALCRMEGVGETYVLLSVGTGRDDGYTGAVVVCRGAADPAVRLRIVETVAAFTQLGSNRIVVEKMIS